MAREWTDLFVLDETRARALPAPEPEKRGRFFKRLRENMKKTRDALGAELTQTLFDTLDDDRVRYVGPVGPQERDALLGSADALLHLVRFAEPFGLSMVEAMACGTPVIGMRLGSVPEVVADMPWDEDPLPAVLPVGATPRRARRARSCPARAPP